MHTLAPSPSRTAAPALAADAAVNFWLMALEAAMAGLLIVTSLLTDPPPVGAAAPAQTVIDASPDTTPADSPAAPGAGQPLEPTHRLVALQPGAAPGSFVITLDEPLPAGASVKFLISKSPAPSSP